ncbi:MAG: hypothetical protein U1F57_08120 [bacterium]
MRQEDRKRVVSEVVHRVLEEGPQEPEAVEQLILDTLYEERRRLENARDRRRAAPNWHLIVTSRKWR